MNRNFKEFGITGPDVAGVYSRNSKRDIADIIELANDAALPLQTNPNIGIPAVLTSWVDTEVSNVLYNPRNATKLAPEKKKGDWTTAMAIFPVRENSGYIAPYGDFSPNGRSDVNYNFPARVQALFQTVIEYGDWDRAMTAEAKLNLASDKQRAAAETIAIAANYFYLFGVSGKEIYGLLNDPNLNAVITPAATGTGNGTTWKTKDTLAIYEDILDLFGELVNQNKNINQSMPITLAVSPKASVELGKTTQYGLSVMNMLEKYFTGGLEVIVLPELESATAGGTLLMQVRTILGEEVSLTAFGEKYRVFPLVREMSGDKQKVAFSTYGGIVKHPSCIAAMVGI